MRYFIIDDDTASRRMLHTIINESGIGLVIGEAKSGVESLSDVLLTDPDIVLIDLLMPELDGIETIEQLRNEGFQGQFIMISQVVNKEMVGEAYEQGVEFFIHKPINRVEVTSILKKTKEQFQLKNSLLQIRESLSLIDPDNKQERQQDVKGIVISILKDMGIVGEAGSDDIISVIEIAMNQHAHHGQLPPLKELYEATALKCSTKKVDIHKESKAIEQRIRRTILTAVNNLATLGSIDYTNPEFEYYAPRYFDFQEIRNRMMQIQKEDANLKKIKVNIRKFLQVLYLETSDKYK